MRRLILPIIAVLVGGLLALFWDRITDIFPNSGQTAGVAEPVKMSALPGLASDFEKPYPRNRESVVGASSAEQFRQLYSAPVNYSYISNLNEDEPIRQDLSAVGRVDFLDAVNEEAGHCTGVAISETHILTAGHCFYKDGEWRAYTRAIFQMDLLWPEGTLGRPAPLVLELDFPQTLEEATAEAHKDNWVVSYTDGGDPDRYTLDYAILPFKEASAWEAASARGKIPASLAAPEISSGDGLFVGHHALGWEQVLSARGEKCLVVMERNEAETPQFNHNCDTQPGSSGAPVFSENYRSVIGLHVCCDIPGANDKIGNNFAVRIEEIASDLAGRGSNLFASFVDHEPLTEEQQRFLAQMEKQAALSRTLLNDDEPRIASYVSYEAMTQLYDRPDSEEIGARATDLEASLISALERLERFAFQHDGDVNHASFSPDGLRIITASQDGHARLWSAETGTLIGEPMQHGYSDVVHASFSPDGLHIVTTSKDGTARLWLAETGTSVGEPMDHDDEVVHASFSPDGSRIVTASWDGTARLWSAETGARIVDPMKHDSQVTHAAFSPDGSRIVTTTMRGSVRLTSMGTTSMGGSAYLWSTDTGMLIGKPMPHEALVAHAAFSPDGSRIVTTSWDNTARLWSAETGMPIGDPMEHDGEVVHASFSPDGLRIVTASVDISDYERPSVARLWSGETGVPIGEPMQHDGSVSHAVFSPDDLLIVTASYDGSARLWSAETGMLIGKPMEHDGGVVQASFSPDGSRIITTSDDGTARLWFTEVGAPIGKPMQHASHSNGDVVYAEFSADGSRIVTASRDETARLWSAETGASLGELMQHDGDVVHASFSPDGSRIVTASWDGTARLWSAETGALIVDPMEHNGPVEYASFSPDGSRIVTASWDVNGDPVPGAARLWSANTGMPIGVPMEHYGGVIHASFSPDGSRIVTASYNGSVRLWSAETGMLIVDQMWHDEDVVHASFSSDGSRIVTASNDGSARLWSAETGELLVDPMRHYYGDVVHASFNPDGSRIVTASHDGSVRLWSADTGTLLVEPMEQDDNVMVKYASFSPDGLRIVTASSDGTARLWSAETGRPIGEPMEHYGGVLHASFSPDGSRIVTTSEDGTARIWSTPPAGRALLICVRKQLARTAKPARQLCQRYDLNCDVTLENGDAIADLAELDQCRF